MTTKNEVASPDKKHKVVIRWGSDPEAKATLCHYSFDTEEELEAFLRGVNEASGWLDYELVDPDHSQEET